MRAVTNVSGTAVATLLIGKRVGEFDRDQARRVLDGAGRVDESTMIDDEDLTHWPSAHCAGTLSLPTR